MNNLVYNLSSEQESEQASTHMPKRVIVVVGFVSLL